MILTQLLSSVKLVKNLVAQVKRLTDCLWRTGAASLQGAFQDLCQDLTARLDRSEDEKRSILQVIGRLSTVVKRVARNDGAYTLLTLLAWIP